MTARQRLAWRVAAVVFVLVVLSAAGLAASHSTADGAAFVIGGATFFLLLVVGVPWVILVAVKRAAVTRARDFVELSEGSLVGFPSVSRHQLASRIKSLGADSPFHVPFALRAIYVAAFEDGLQVLYLRGPAVKLPWLQIGAVSYSETSKSGLRFPVVSVSVDRAPSRVELEFLAPRHNPAAVREIVDQMEDLRSAAGTVVLG